MALPVLLQGGRKRAHGDAARGVGLEAYPVVRASVACRRRDGDQRSSMVGPGWQRSTVIRLRQQVTVGPHSPAEFRVIGPLRNVDAWYEAFDVQPGTKYYLAPEDRVRIW